jgi:hypothetical protein
MKKSVLHSLGHAVLVFAYITLVATLLSNAQKLFGDQDNNFWIPVAMLMLFVFSATITGVLVLGRPAILYFGGQKKEAFQFLGYTAGWLFIFTVVAFVVLALRSM